MPDEKNEAPPSTLTAMGRGLDVTTGSGPLEKYGPLVALVVYLVLMLIQVFWDVPNPEALAVITGLLGPIVGGYVAKMGAT